MAERFERHARTVSLLTMISRVTGLARDASLSRVFGAGALTDAFFFAFMIPNLFRRLFGEGALAAAFLPVYSRLERDDPDAARRLASLTIALLVGALGGLVLLGEAILFVISAAADHGNLAVWLMMIMLPYMPMVCLVAILGAMLQVHGRFGPTAAAPVILNLCIIAAAIGGSLLLSDEIATADAERARVLHIGGVALAVLIAGVLQVGWSMLALRRYTWWRRDFSTARGQVRDVIRAAVPMMLGLGVLQVNTLFDGLIASYPTAVGGTILGVAYPLEEGAMAAVSFAQRLYQFPLGVFGIAVATAIFPALARLSGDDESFTRTVGRGLRLVVFIGLPASLGLILVREPLSAVILEGGDFTADDTQRVGFVLLGYAPAVWAYSMMHVLTRAFYARRDTMTPVKVATSVVVLNLALNCTLIWTPLREAGLAWSTAACSTVQAALLVMLLRRRTGAIITRAVGGSWMRSIAATGLMTAMLLAGVALLGDQERSWAESLAVLSALVIAGAAIYAVAAVALRMPELRWALGGTSDR
jgi:putative peptidoglycan lipid II flippase